MRALFNWNPEEVGERPVPIERGFRFIRLSDLGDLDQIEQWLLRSDPTLVSPSYPASSCPAGIVECNRFVLAFKRLHGASEALHAYSSLYVRIVDCDTEEVALRLSF